MVPNSYIPDEMLHFGTAFTHTDDVNAATLTTGDLNEAWPPVKKIDEIEKQPAYKRMGIDLDETENNDDTTISRTSLGSTDDDDIEFRSNNSFLHDNVD